MIIMLQPNQIAEYWDGIKYALQRAHDLTDEQFPACANRALENLMTGKYQCWLTGKLQVDGTKEIHAVVITCIVEHGLFGYKMLIVDTVYGYRPVDDEIILEAIKAFRAYGQTNGCLKVVAETNHDRVRDIMAIAGLQFELSRYSLTI